MYKLLVSWVVKTNVRLSLFRLHEIFLERSAKCRGSICMRCCCRQLRLVFLVYQATTLSCIDGILPLHFLRKSGFDSNIRIVWEVRLLSLRAKDLTKNDCHAGNLFNIDVWRTKERHAYENYLVLVHTIKTKTS